MASTEEYLRFILEGCEELSARAMMGEYVLYYKEKIVGGIYDNRLLVKPVPSAKQLLPSAEYQLPYVGAKEMILIDNVENKKALLSLFEEMYEELPETKKKRKI